MSSLLICSRNSVPRLFHVVLGYRNLSLSSHRHLKLENLRVPWDYLHVRRKLAERFANRFEFERLLALGPDLACLEWLMNCGATNVEMSDQTIITTQQQMREYIASHGIDVKQKKLMPRYDVKLLDQKGLDVINMSESTYNSRWRDVPPVYIKAVDASDSVVADPGFQYFIECKQIEKIVLGFCDFFGDLAIENLAKGRARVTLKELEILFNPHMSDIAFYNISKLTALKRAHFYFNPYVINEARAKERLRVACPRCYITYPAVKYVGTGKEK